MSSLAMVNSQIPVDRDVVDALGERVAFLSRRGLLPVGFDWLGVEHAQAYFHASDGEPAFFQVAPAGRTGRELIVATVEELDRVSRNFYALARAIEAEAAGGALDVCEGLEPMPATAASVAGSEVTR